MDEERHDPEEQYQWNIEAMVIDLIGQCQAARFYAGTEKQRTLLDALQKFLEI